MVVSFFLCIFVSERKENMEEELKYNLIGIDGNAFYVMGYVRRAMMNEGFTKSEIDCYLKDAQSDDYNHLLQVSIKMIDECNERYDKR